MPATRLLVVAEPKMLTALANGLRLGARFEIATAPFAESTDLAPLCDAAEVVALFYGSRTWSLSAALQSITAGVRGRGGRLIAVLQKDQAQLRDDCFRAGASDVLFMPMPKDQFIAKLFESASLALADDVGVSAQVQLGRVGPGAQVAAQTIAAKVTAGGLIAAGGPSLAAGETVQLSWSGGPGFSRWGLVAKSEGAELRVRIAGTSAEEDLLLRAWLKGQPFGGPSTAGSGSTAAPLFAPTIVDTPSFPAPVPTLVQTPSFPGAAPTVVETPSFPGVAATQLDAKAIPPTLLEVKSFGSLVTEPAVGAAPQSGVPPMAPGAKISGGGAIVAGPPPGFAARPPIRPQSVRMTAPGRPRSIETELGPAGEMPLPASPTTSGPGSKGVAAGIATPAALVTNGGARASDPRLAKVAPETALAAGPRTSDPALKSVSTGEPRTSDPGLKSVATSALHPTDLAAPATSNSGLASLFDEPAAEGAGTAAPPPALAPLPSWPALLDAALARALLTTILRDKQLPTDAPAEPGAAVRKVFGALPSVDREALEKVGADSHLHEALVARVQLAHASAEGLLLCAGGAGALVDDAGFGALIQAAESASKRLQAEADRAIAKGEVETLQQVTAASAALSRELLSFKEIADRLRGLAAAPRLGASELDPSVAAAIAQKPISLRRDKEKDDARAEQRKLALADFIGMEDKPKAQRQKRYLWIGLVVLIISAGNALWFGAPGVRAGSAPLVEQAGSGVLEIALSKKTAMVTIAATWLNGHDRKARLASMCSALESKGIRQAAIFLDGKGLIGQVQVAGCQPLGLPQPKPPPPELGGAPKPR